jgi:hypothetical protein
MLTKLFSSIYSDPIVATLLGAAVLGVIGWLWRRLIVATRARFDHIEGLWFAHLIVSNGKTLITHDVQMSFSANPFRSFVISMKENTEESFQYGGYAQAIDQLIFFSMKGVSQFDHAFLTLRAPFNRGRQLDYISGVLSGVTQYAEPCATFVILSRSRLDLEQVSKELPTHCGPIIVSKEPIQVESRKLKAAPITSGDTIPPLH